MWPIGIKKAESMATKRGSFLTPAGIGKAPSPEKRIQGQTANMGPGKPPVPPIKNISKGKMPKGGKV